MKANTRRGNRLAFDEVAAVYDQARPGIPDHLVTTIVDITGLAPSDPVLEVGAGTGQLTMPLRAAGVEVTAVEPGERLRALLSKRTAGDSGVTVLGGFFEDLPDLQAPAGTFAAVVSANAWQWLDPSVSYTKAADLLRPGGHLALIWNFPIVADTRLQHELNKRAFGDYPDAVRDPATHLPGLQAHAAEGRAELAASDRFETPWWQFTTDTLSLSPDAYYDLLLSYANAAVLDAAARTDMAHRVHTVLTDHGADTVPMLNHLYACIARRADR
ncbi:class I SAM-dependent methyltransferase [Streptomyces sp. ME19-01-6]|uniref:class I SAM-dependent methyltransferase n=1 Tax=Streptomyces sp. ME19-01-6 TaxID=3028686 RepID=UPI0029B74A37|nr:methyltransferase domain-containing protein [Streptomyces sp. ME19-01-6]MDX3232552.1 methyltransferase domain-containing protein [Streptomyces sp. ME19-01-6]